MQHSPTVRVQHVNKLATAVATIVILSAMAYPAQAQVVYQKLNIVVNQGSYNLDLNGVTHFTIYSDESTGCTPTRDGQGLLTETPAGGNGAMVGPLVAGDEIGPSQTFSGDKVPLSQFTSHWSPIGGFHCQYFWNGTWCSPGHAQGCDAITGYLGLSALLNGKTYYGWLQLSIPGDSISVTLLGVAYETTPGKAIQAGQTK